MPKSIVIRADRQPLRVWLITGSAVLGLLALADSDLAFQLATMSVIFWFSGLGCRHVIFGEKFLNIRQEMLSETLINYRNIKTIAEKSERLRHGEKIKIALQLHDDREIEIDVSLFKAEDRKRIRELLLQKLAAIELIHS